LNGDFLTTETVLEGNNAICLGLELLIESSLSLLHSLCTTITTPLKEITDNFGAAIKSLDCPRLVTGQNGGEDILASWKGTYPGAARAGWLGDLSDHDNEREEQRVGI
jgi:hypothetical protein